MTDEQDLLHRIAAIPDAPNSGALANELLSAFHRGYPVEKLRPLLTSEDERVVRTGTWLASELGEKGRPLLRDIAPLLSHPAKNVRFFAIDCVLCWATPANGRELYSVLSLIEDPEPNVRWKVMDFLTLASPEQLQSALLIMEATRSDGGHAERLRWLLGTGGQTPDEVVAAIRSKNLLTQRYGVAAAVRMAQRTGDLLSDAPLSPDPAVNQFVQDMIELGQHSKKGGPLPG